MVDVEALGTHLFLLQNYLSSKLHFVSAGGSQAVAKPPAATSTVSKSGAEKVPVGLGHEGFIVETCYAI